MTNLYDEEYPFTPGELASLMLEVRIGQRYCCFKGAEVHLSPTLFDVFLIAIQNPGIYKRLDPDDSDNRGTEREKTWVKRINKLFRETKKTNEAILQSKELVGYRINPSAIDYDSIRIFD